MDWNSMTIDERLVLWRKLRKGLEKSTLNEQLQSTANFFARTPYGKTAIDIEDKESWQTPWEILTNSMQCRSSISILINDTMALIDEKLDTKLLLVEDFSGKYLLAVVNGEFVLNYVPGQVLKLEEIATEFKIIGEM